MAKSERRWFYLIERRRFDNLTAHDALDMVRYDAARVECNAPTGYYLLSTGADHGPNLDRLRSYHLGPAWLRGPVGVEWGASQAWEWFHALPHPQSETPRAKAVR